MKTILFLFFLSVASTLFAQKENAWKTRFEKSGYLETETYDETINYFEKLAQASSYAELQSIGKSPQGRNMYVFIAAKGNEFTPESAATSGKPVILIENGIHSGEIEGKDACMLLMREILITKEKESLLDSVIILIVPVFNVDGHERRSPYNRINQNGPEEMGWRVTAQNLNLNRDFAKVDTPEMKNLLTLFQKWNPDFFVDTHTTDGADYQYTITYGIETGPNQYFEIGEWIDDSFIPFAEKYVEESGFLISPYVGFMGKELKDGLRKWVPGPRFSNGYAAVMNRPGLLIETHMLKPYKDRVFSTKALLEAAIIQSGKSASELKKINKDADDFAARAFSGTGKSYPLKFRASKTTNDSIDYKGYEYSDEFSELANGKIRKYSKKKLNITVPFYDVIEITDSVALPVDYLIPQEWSEIIERMKYHGINSYQLAEPEKFIVERYKFKNVKFPSFPYEGRFSPVYEYDIFVDTVTVPAGSYIVPTNQKSVGMIAHLLEPKGSDSFVKWGFFNAVFERKEYFEMYSMEPIARKMYESDSELKKEFDEKTSADSSFSKNPRARLNWFYERSPYYDNHVNLYPVMRVIKKLE
ncbi:MAG: M14 family metallopeptidase [Chlorobi bacterium]|nr:M14 family metallopeptidase [Chlorobiota bacterium]